MARKLGFDRMLFTSVVLLLGLGLVMVYSSSVAVSHGVGSSLERSPFVKQLIAAGLGLTAMAAAMAIDYRLWSRPWVLYTLLSGVVALLVCVLFTPARNGGSRWLSAGGFSLQPSELTKLAVILYLAYQVERRHWQVNRPVTFAPCFVVVSVLVILVVLEPDLSTALLIVTVSAFMLFVGGLSGRYVAAATLISVPFLLVLVVAVPYRWARIAAFWNPEDEPLRSGYQVLQSLIAVGSGGLSGLGLGQSLQKLHFLPEANSDFIFAILCEELGLLGGCGVLLLLAVIGWRGLRAGVRAPDSFGRFVAWGVTSMILVQALVNISVAVNLLPATGTPLPLISSGGSSLVVVLAGCGLLLNVSQHA